MGHASGADGKNFPLRHENRTAETWASEKHLKTGLMRVKASEWSVALFQKHAMWCPYGPDLALVFRWIAPSVPLSPVTIFVSFGGQKLYHSLSPLLTSSC